MAVTNDIGNIHPTNKKEVGRRLSLWALAKTYGSRSAHRRRLPCRAGCRWRRRGHCAHDPRAIRAGHVDTGAADPTGHDGVRRVLQGLTRQAAGRGRGQADPLTADDVAAILATASLPRRTGRGMESDTAAAEQGAVNKVIVAVLFQGGLRRSERRRSVGRTCRTRRTGAASSSTSAGRKPTREGKTARKVAYYSARAAASREPSPSTSERTAPGGGGARLRRADTKARRRSSSRLSCYWS